MKFTNPNINVYIITFMIFLKITIDSEMCLVRFIPQSKEFPRCESIY
jgi:hypothetical protein